MLYSTLWKGSNMPQNYIEELKGMSMEERGALPWNDPRLMYVAEKLESKYELPEGSLRAIAHAENSGIGKDGRLSPSKRKAWDSASEDQAVGLMQFIPSTMKLQDGMFEHDPRDPIESMNAAAKYLQYTLKNQYKGNIAAAFADYNGGPSNGTAVMGGGKPTNKETLDYLKKIKLYYQRGFGKSQSQGEVNDI